MTQISVMHNAASKQPRFLHIRASPWFIVTCVSVAFFTDTFLYGLLVSVFPFALEQRAGISADQVQAWNSILLGLYGAGSMIGSPVFGWLADKMDNRRTPFLGGLILFMFATGLIWMGQNVALFACGRFMQGLATSIVWAVGLALVIDTVPSDEIGRNLGFTNLGLSIGLVSGPLCGGILFQHGGWNAVFACAVLLLSVDVFFRLVMIEKRDALRYYDSDETPRDDPTQRLLSSTVELNLEEASTKAPTSAFLKLIKSPRLICAIFCTMAEAMVECGLDATLPLHLHETFGFSPSTTGLVFITLIAPSFLSPVVGHLSDIWGPRIMAISGFLLTGLSCLLLCIPNDNSPQQITLLITLLTIIGFAIALVMTPLMIDISLSVEEIEKEDPDAFGENGAYAQAYGLYNLGYSTGMLLGPIALGFLRQYFSWSLTSLSTGVFCVAISVPAYYFLGSKTPVSQDTD